MKLCGFNTQHWPGKMFDKACNAAIESLDYNFCYKLYSSWLNDADCFADLPLPIISDALIKNYPEAKFIIIFRAADEWLRSARKHVEKRSCDNLELLQYSLLTGEVKPHLKDYTDKEMIVGYKKFHVDLVNKLAKNKSDFIVLELDDENISGKLSSFLGIDDVIDFSEVDITKNKK